MDDINTYLEEMRAQDFPVAVMRILTRIHEELETKRQAKATVNRYTGYCKDKTYV